MSRPPLPSPTPRPDRTVRRTEQHRTRINAGPRPMVPWIRRYLSGVGPSGASWHRLAARACRNAPREGWSRVLSEGDGDHLVAWDHLDPLAALGRAELALVGVEQLPAAPGPVRDAAALEPLDHRRRLRHRGRRQRGRVLDQVPDGLRGIRLRVPDESDRTTLDPVSYTH